MAVTAELVIDSNRTSYLRSPTRGLVTESELQVRVPSARVESVALPPDQFYEIGPILRRLGVNVQERRFNLWERVSNFFRAREMNKTRTVVYDMK